MFDPDKSHIYISCGENFPTLLVQSGRFYTGDGRPITRQELPEFVVTELTRLSVQTKATHGIAGIV